MAQRVSQVVATVIANAAATPDNARVSQVTITTISSIAVAPPPPALAPIVTIRFGGMKVYEE